MNVELMNEIVACVGFWKTQLIENLKEDKSKFLPDNSDSISGYTVLDTTVH